MNYIEIMEERRVRFEEWVINVLVQPDFSLAAKSDSIVQCTYGDLDIEWLWLAWQAGRKDAS